MGLAYQSLYILCYADSDTIKLIFDEGCCLNGDIKTMLTLARLYHHKELWESLLNNMISVFNLQEQGKEKLSHWLAHSFLSNPNGLQPRLLDKVLYWNYNHLNLAHWLIVMEAYVGNDKSPCVVHDIKIVI